MVVQDAFHKIRQQSEEAEQYNNNTDEMSPRSEDFAEDLEFITKGNQNHLAINFNQPITELDEENHLETSQLHH